MDGEELVRRSRLRSGLSKQAFAGRVGTSRMALDLIEAGRRTPGIDLAQRIAAAGGLCLVLADRPAPVAPGATLADHVDGTARSAIAPVRRSRTPSVDRKSMAVGPAPASGERPRLRQDAA